MKTVFVEAVAEGPDSERVMRDLVAAQGARLVFATSFGYLEPALRVAAEFPAAKFEHAGGYKSAPNLATYDARELGVVIGWPLLLWIVVGRIGAPAQISVFVGLALLFVVDRIFRFEALLPIMTPVRPISAA